MDTDRYCQDKCQLDSCQWQEIDFKDDGTHNTPATFFWCSLLRLKSAHGASRYDSRDDGGNKKSRKIKRKSAGRCPQDQITVKDIKKLEGYKSGSMTRLHSFLFIRTSKNQLNLKCS